MKVPEDRGPGLLVGGLVHFGVRSGPIGALLGGFWLSQNSTNMHQDRTNMHQTCTKSTVPENRDSNRGRVRGVDGGGWEGPGSKQSSMYGIS